MYQERTERRPEADLTPLVGHTFSGCKRVGKALLFKLENPGAGNKYFLSRLGMTGGWSVKPTDYDYRQHAWRVVMTLSHPQGKILLVFKDLRRFGTIECRDKIEDIHGLQSFGPEIMSSAFSKDWVAFVCSRHDVPIKALLLEQRYFPGIGNWLASEILFHAHIHPLISAKILDTEEIKRLFVAIHLVINNAIHRGGATLDSWKNAKGEEGHAQEDFMVYGRKGHPCLICGAPIQKISIRKRGTFFCTQCQKAGWEETAPVSQEFVKQVLSISQGLGDMNQNLEP